MSFLNLKKGYEQKINCAILLISNFEGLACGLIINSQDEAITAHQMKLSLHFSDEAIIGLVTYYSFINRSLPDDFSKKSDAVIISIEMFIMNNFCD